MTEFAAVRPLLRASWITSLINFPITITDGVDMNARSTPAHNRKSASRMTPRPHQEEALKAIREATGDRALVVMACGTGKSLVAREVARERFAPTVLVTVPTLALAEQIYQGWAAEFPGELDALIVCADSAVGGTAVPVTVAPDRIAEFLTSTQSVRMRLLISTYHSVGRIAEAYSLHSLPPLDLAVLDEAHHTAGRAGKKYSIVLDNERIPADFRLSLTATSLIHEDSDGTADVVSMDDETLYGKRVFELTTGSAIQRKLLADYEVAIVLVSDADVHAALLRQESSHAGAGGGDTAMVAAQIALSRTMREHDLQSVIAFHSRVARSKRFSATLGEIGAATADVRITSLHMDGSTPAVARTAQLELLARPASGQHVVLNNVRTLTEGVDVSGVGGVCLVDPKSSQTDIVQAVGRALRLHPDHDRPALILLPVYLAPGESPQAVLEASSFQHVWRVLATLRDQDERMDAALTVARRCLGGETSEPRDNTKVRSVLPDRVKIYSSADVDSSFVNALGVRVLERSTEDWYHFYGLLERYVAAHGHAVVPSSNEAGTLGSWAKYQRRFHAAGKLLPKRAALLESQSGWTWRLADAKRERGRKELKAFVTEHGHAGVPRGHVTASGYRLDHFVTLVRNRRRYSLMDAEEIAYYEALPGWMWHVHDAKFERFLQHLDQFITQYGHARIPQHYKSELNGETFELGHAVSSKRARYRKGTLPDGQAEALEKRPEWAWDGLAAVWEANFNALAGWAAKHDNIKVPFDKPVDGFNVYRWLLQQKKLIRQGKLAKDRRLRLEALPGWF
ncbi:Helicase associated domain protein [Streptomyces sp. NPDC059788]|uniref:DEAD/DEAH box helicase n=1 Tax=Streptomyces sp. NPDC059788 TaxID=3346948 RepID=UPI00365FDA57